MITDLWINLPVKDIKRSREFFANVGFSFNPKYGNSDESISLLVGDKNIVVMLVPEPTFKGFTRNEVAEAKRGTEVLLSIGAESKEQVDEMAKNWVKAGGTVYGQPGNSQGWMYGAGFVDLDGHRWNMLYMDMSKMPK